MAQKSILSIVLPRIQDCFPGSMSHRSQPSVPPDPRDTKSFAAACSCSQVHRATCRCTQLYIIQTKKKLISRVVEIVPGLSILAALAENLTLVPNTYTEAHSSL